MQGKVLTFVTTDMHLNPNQFISQLLTLQEGRSDYENIGLVCRIHVLPIRAANASTDDYNFVIM
jgi:hypothetical protein